MRKKKFNLFGDLRRYEISGKVVIASIFIFLFSGILSRALTGSPLYMLRLTGIFGKTLPVWFYIIIWSAWYILLGFCFGTVIGGRFPGKAVYKFKGSLCLIVMMIFNLIWYPLFFSAGSPFLALIDLILIIIFCFLTLAEYSKISRFIGFIIFLHIAWLIWCFVINLKIFLSI